MTKRLFLAGGLAAAISACAAEPPPLAVPVAPESLPDPRRELASVEFQVPIRWQAHGATGRESWLEGHLDRAARLNRVSFSLPKGATLADAAVMASSDGVSWKTTWQSWRVTGLASVTVPMPANAVASTVRVVLHALDARQTPAVPGALVVYGLAGVVAADNSHAQATPTPRPLAPTPTPAPALPSATPQAASPGPIPVAGDWTSFTTTLTWLSANQPWSSLQVDAQGQLLLPTPVPTPTATPTPTPTATPTATPTPTTPPPFAAAPAATSPTDPPAAPGDPTGGP